MRSKESSKSEAQTVSESDTAERSNAGLTDEVFDGEEERA